MRAWPRFVAAVMALVPMGAFAPTGLTPEAEPSPEIIDFEDVETGVLDPDYRADVLTFEQTIVVSSSLARGGNAAFVSNCIDDVGDCPRTLTFTTPLPLVGVRLYVGTDLEQTVRVEAFDGSGGFLSDVTVPSSDAFDSLAELTGRGIREIRVTVVEDDEIRVIVDDIELVPEMPDVILDPPQIDFGSVEVATEAVQLVTVTNSGNVELLISLSPSSPAIDVRPGGCTDPVPVDGSCRFEVVLQTGSPGEANAFVDVRDDVVGLDRPVAVTGRIEAPLSTAGSVRSATEPSTVAPGSTPSPSTTAREDAADDSRLTTWIGLLVLVAIAAAAVVVVVARRRVPPSVPLVQPVNVRVVDHGATAVLRESDTKSFPISIESSGAVTTFKKGVSS
jgi:hypothetical protein